MLRIQAASKQSAPKILTVNQIIMAGKQALELVIYANLKLSPKKEPNLGKYDIHD